ncbi:MAG: hypothetical protein ACK535_11210 [Cyanobacteriota bacterium]
MKFINLRKFYFILAVISSLAAAQSMILPRWPQASKISSDKLNRFISIATSKGTSINPTILKSNHSDFHASHSPIISLKVNSNSNLFLTNAQVRDRAEFSVAFITDSIKSLKLSSSAIKGNQPPFSLSEETKAGTTFQTCFVPGNSSPSNFGFSQDHLSLAVDKLKSTEKNLGLKRFLGLSPSRRYQCMLVTLKSTLPRQEGYQLWLDLLDKLQIAFNPKS